MKTIRVLVCRVGRLPVVEVLKSNNRDSFLDEMQRICDGNVQCITLDDGTDLWCNEDGLMLGLPLNRVIPAAPRELPTLFGEPVEVIYADEGLARPGEAGEWRIYGDFFLCNVDDDGEIAPVTSEQIARYTSLFNSEDVAMAQRMNEWRTSER